MLLVQQAGGVFPYFVSLASLQAEKLIKSTKYTLFFHQKCICYEGVATV